MNRTEAEAHYQDKGLETEYGFDKPGTIYKPHTHEKTWLYTLSGSIAIKLGEGEWRTLQPNTEFVVGSGQLHEAKVGKDGWEWVAAWDAEEAEKFEADSV